MMSEIMPEGESDSGDVKLFIWFKQYAYITFEVRVVLRAVRNAIGALFCTMP